MDINITFLYANLDIKKNCLVLIYMESKNKCCNLCSVALTSKNLAKRTQRCLTCHSASEKERHKKYRDNNLEKCREQHRQYLEDNKEKLKEKHKQYYEANKEKIKEKKRDDNPFQPIIKCASQH